MEKRGRSGRSIQTARHDSTRGDGRQPWLYFSRCSVARSDLWVSTRLMPVVAPIIRFGLFARRSAGAWAAHPPGGIGFKSLLQVGAALTNSLRIYTGCLSDFRGSAPPEHFGQQARDPTAVFFVQAFEQLFCVIFPRLLTQRSIPPSAGNRTEYRAFP